MLADPPHPNVDSNGLSLFGVGEHTDYGYLTLLLQDNSGGLQVKLDDGSWIDAPPIQGSLVVNVGDALEHNTGCLFKSVPHRVKHTCSTNRMSFPFFFDASFSKTMVSVVSQLPEGVNGVFYVLRLRMLLICVCELSKL
jgi:isopenicillin N synthase-like dioxygenase